MNREGCVCRVPSCQLLTSSSRVEPPQCVNGFNLGRQAPAGSPTHQERPDKPDPAGGHTEPRPCVFSGDVTVRSTGRSGWGRSL